MKSFYNENKKSIWLFISIFIFLLAYDLFLIAAINDLPKVKTIHDIHYLYEIHPLLPLSRIIYNLYPIQYFDYVGFKEIIITFTYIVNSLSIFEIIFLILILINFALFLFRRSKINTLTFFMVLMQFLVFVGHLGFSLVKIFNSLVFINYPVNMAMSSIRIATIVALSSHLCILFLCLSTMIYLMKQKN